MIVRTSVIAMCALLATPAAAQSPSWNAEQTAVWAVVQQSWADETARNGRWPGTFVHDRFTSFDASFPFPRYRQSFDKWVRFNDGQRQTIQYEIAPSAITVVGDTAVVHYTGVTYGQRGTDKPEREMFGVSETLVRQSGNWRFLSSTGWEMKGS